MQLFLREATRADAESLGRRLRPLDAAEAFAASGLCPHKAVVDCWQRSEFCVAGYSSSHPLPVAIFGFAHLSWDCVSPWMLCVDVPRGLWPAFMRTSRRLSQALSERFPRQRGWVDARHVQAQKWLALLGFSFSEPLPYGPFGLPFLEFFK